MNLAGRAVLITGGKRIGAVVASELARRGADVALTYRTSPDEANQTAEVVRAAGRRAGTIKVDLRVPADCRRAVDEAAAMFGGLDVLINMASTYHSVSFDALTEQAWNDQLAVDLTSAFLCAQAAVPHLRSRGGGHIINFTDWVARSGRPRYRGYLPYYVAKTGIIALTEALALELSEDGILVNAIAPGPIVAPEGTSDEELRAVEQSTPLKRWGGPHEIANTVLALIDNDFITGETVRVDGGRHLK
jgi:NAD(P)-dependent dehydrogenase (short-subunit alcohol dehydrogenase family)